MTELGRDSPLPVVSPVYECDQCGACCQGSLLVEAEWLDAVREPRLLGAKANPDSLTLADLEAGRIVLLTGNRPCPFLDEGCQCSIYPTRPNVCVAFEAGSDQCQEVRQRQGLQPLAPVSATGKERGHVG